MSVIVDVAEAVKDSLNVGLFGMAFTAERTHVPSFALAELQDLHVTVVPKTLGVTNATRTSSYFDCTIDVGIQKSVNGDVDVDAMIDLSQQIIDHLRKNPLAGYPEASFVEIGNDPVMSPEHLDQHRQFTGVVTATYRVKR